MNPGYLGVLDFTFIPAGQPEVVTGTRAPKVGGRKRRLIRYLIEEEMHRAQLAEQLASSRELLFRYVHQKVEYERFTTFVESFKRQQETNAVLAEV